MFGLACAAGHAVAYGSISETSALGQLRQRLFDGHHAATAWLSAMCLRPFHNGVSAHDERLSSPTFSLGLGKGCDAVPPSILVLAGVAAMPVGWRARAIGALLLMAAVQALNVVRVASLFLVGVHWHSAFDTMHMEVWPAIFILFAVGSWSAWAVWAMKGAPGATEAGPQHEPTPQTA